MENLVADQPTRLCIVSRDRLRREAFVAALQGSLSTEPDLQIIVDRRRAGSSGGPELKEDRRRQQQVDLALEANGFAIVPASVEPAVDRTSFAPLFPVVPIERLSPEELPREERLSPEDGEGDERLESSRGFRRSWSGVIPELIGVLSGVTLAALVLSLAGQFMGRNLISELFTGPPSSGPGQPPGPTNERFTSARLPTVTEEFLASETRPSRAATPPSARPNNESSAVGGPASTKSVSPRDADRPTPGEKSGPSKTTDSSSREPGATSRENSAPPKETSASLRSASTPADEAGAPAGAGAGQGASIDRTRSSAAVRPSPSAPAPSNPVASAPSPAATSSAAPPLAGSHRAELVRGPVSRGWGDSYVVRLLDPAGRPMVAFEILLVAQMADGTVEKSPMGALPERGTYRATVPTSRSTPVDLRIRVSTGEKFVEVPVRR
jgi:hypothetical protein